VILGQNLLAMASREDFLENILKNSKNFTFPTIRRMSPKLINHEIVSVQQMKSPVGSIFYLNQKYGTNHALNKKLKLAGLKKKVSL
jgi:hypothetical protein